MRAPGRLAIVIPAIVLLLLLLPRPAAAIDVAALYRAYWAGMPAGEIRLAVHDTAGGAYRDEIEIRAEGLPQLLTRFRAAAVSEGRLAVAATALPAPLRYDARYALRKRRNERLAMRFATQPGAASGGGALVADRAPGDTSRRPPLPARLRTSVVDPLSALNALRDRVRRGDRGPFTVPVYDGARRFDVIARVLPKLPNNLALQVRLVLSPIAGFKGEASDDGNPDDERRTAMLTMTDDARLMPLSLRVSLDDLPLDIEWQSWCDSSGGGGDSDAAATACR